MEGTDAQARLAEACLATMLKYVENIQAHPEDAKYRRLRASNAIFQERVTPVPGALGRTVFALRQRCPSLHSHQVLPPWRVVFLDALLAAGFERQELAPAEPAGAPAEPFYLFSGDAAALDGLKALLQQKVELNRDVRVRPRPFHAQASDENRNRRCTDYANALGGKPRRCTHPRPRRRLCRCCRTITTG